MTSNFVGTGARAAVFAGMALATALVASATRGVAQAPDLRNSQVDVAYVTPLNPNHLPIQERLQKRQVLEELRTFLAPLRLPRKLLVKTEGCKGVTNSWYDPRTSTITLCYEYVDYIRRLAPSGPTPQGFTPEDAVLGPFVALVLHETSHAVFDLLQVPVLGREEDAADYLAAYILMNFGKDVARRTMTGVVYIYGFEASNDKPDLNMFADVHGTAAQRFYNNLCIAFGGDPQTFKDFVQKTLLPKQRADGCAYEYAKLRNAFNKLILPHVDTDLLKLVQARDWLKPDDGR